MRTLMIVVSGLAALSVFIVIARLLKRSAADGARYFILPWLAASLVNFCLGVFRANVPVSVEIPVLAVVFGVPAAIAWYVSRRPSGA
jgi:hypothetical protein